MNGVYGVFGANASGKSSILDTLIFTLFDKTSRCFKGNHVLNVRKTSFNCKLEFEISGIHYFIERRGSTTRSGNVKVDVRFWKVVNGVEEELHGTARRDTNDIIRDYIGTYDDFILTTTSFQSAKNSVSFIDMGNSERKDLLVQFIGLNVFDRLCESANERNKELNTLLKIHKDKNYFHEVQQNQNALSHAETIFSEIEKEVNSLKKQISDVNEQIVFETTRLIKLDDTVPTNLPQLEERKTAAEQILGAKRKFIVDTRETMSGLEKTISELTVEIEKIEKSNFVESHKMYKVLSDKINELKQKIDLKKVEIKGKLEKAVRLDKHEYDPNCKYCVNNSFVKDATKAKKELVEDKKDADRMMETLESLRNDLKNHQWVEKVYETYTKLLTQRGDVKDKHSSHSRNVIISTNELERLDATYKNVVQQIEIYHRNSISVEANEKVHAIIATYKMTLSRLDIEFQRQQRMLMEVSGKRELFKNQIDTLNKTLREVEALELESELYQYYLTAVGRDGISYQVICNTTPELEKEVNSMLSQVVDYTIQFDTDGKNIIPYIVYSDIGKYPIELASGYERFVSSIAIRIGLTELSNLPRTNMLCIDEGFSTLDPEHLASMSTLFSVIKNYYDFAIVVSHNDTIKDFVDKTIEITHEGGFSKVIFE
jgi:exonuclease SbcC